MTVMVGSTANFTQEVLDYKGIVFVDFYADWCGPCKMTAPIIDQLSQDYQGKMKFLKVNVDANQELASRYSVFSIPTFIIFKNSQPVNQFVGAQSKNDFVKEIKKTLSG